MSKVKTWADFNKFSFSSIAINESDPAQVLSDEDAKAAEEIKKQLGKDGIKIGDGITITDATLKGATLDFSSDGVEVVKKNDVEAAPKEDPNKTPSYSSGGYIVASPPGLSGAHSSDSDDRLKNLGDTIANAAEYARRGLKNTDRSDSPVFGSALSPDARKQIKDYFFGPGGETIPTTIGSSELGLSAFSGSSLNGGIDASNQKTFQSKKAEVLKTENTDLSKATSNLTQPNYYNIDKPSFVGSKEY